MNKLRAVYENFGFPADLQLPTITVTHVVNFGEKTRRRITDFTVNGNFS